MKVELYPHQEKALAKLSNGKILNGDVGSGKSRVAAAYYMLHEAPKDIYVFTTAKKRDSLDFEKEFVRYGVYKTAETTVAGILHVNSWNSIPNFSDIKGAFLILDEQRLVGSGAWVKAFLKMAKHNTWIILSATPGDSWIDYIPVFVANGFFKNATQFKTDHVIYSAYTRFPKVEAYREEVKLIRLRHQILVDMPFERHTTRTSESVRVEFDGEMFTRVLNDRWNVFKDLPVASMSELFYTMRKVVNSDRSRLEAIRDLTVKHKRLIVFYNFDYELEILRRLSDEMLVAEWNGHRKQPLPETDRWVYLVQYVSGCEGWNCITTNAMAFYSLTYSYKVWHQAHGRIDRLNTPYVELFYYVLLSNSVIDKIIWKAILHKKSFNEARFVKKFFQSKSA